MRLHDIERRVLAFAGIALTLAVALLLASWTYAVVAEDDAEGLPVALDILAIALAAVGLAASWPVLHMAFAGAMAGGTRPRHPGRWLAAFVIATAIWSALLVGPLIVLSVVLLWVGFALLALFVIHRAGLRLIRRGRG